MGRGDSLRVGKRGTVVLPAALRRQFGMEEGAMLIAEAVDDGILLRPAVVLPIERYTAARKAEFLLNNAVGADDYARAVQEVRRMGLDPDTIPHEQPLD
ncbi:MAG TPA: AbrB/MazE/SpoVT family DNA-binding domain-containing protein [Longimicrobium sp.]|nr:AbrB/MazE/SpoVT family DNA-binding domain-containing protein [Longimicrobium sp.]